MFKHVGTTDFETYYVAGAMLTVGAFAQVNFVGDILRATPFLSTRGGIIDRIAINVVSGTPSAEFRLGIYQATSQTNLYPKNLILDAGTFSGTSAGVKIGTINTQLQPNILYWFTFNAGGTAEPTIYAVNFDDSISILGSGTAMVDNSNGIIIGQTYGTFSATFPSGGTVIDATPPAIGVRFAT